MEVVDRPTSFLLTFALALVACGGILAQRLSGGSLEAAFVAQVLLTVAAVVMARLDLSLGAQVAAGTLCILLVHAVILVTAGPNLVEGPAQLVNDAVAVFGPIAVVRAARTRPPRTSLLVGTIAAVALYRVTGSHWHLDHGTLGVSVQDLVTGEFAGSALGVTMFHLMT